MHAEPASDRERSDRPLTSSRTTSRPPSSPPALVGLERLQRELETFSRVDSTVLVTGETGTGKGLIARGIHARSSRSARAFVHVDCTALSPTLIESELFGHERGAFTGALEARAGHFERAAGGTIFLDEIGHLAPPLQAKLLRVLQDREYERVGGRVTLRMGARVIAATSRDLDAAIAQGEFRPDLYYRLNVLRVEVPPLRKRLGDLPKLIDAALARACTRLELDRPRLDPSFYARLRDHPWPGNVRELMNVVECLLVRHRPRTLDAAALVGVLSPAQRTSIDSRHAEAASGAPGASGEREQILQVLGETGWNVSRAARRLGLARSTLRYRMGRLGLADRIPRD